MLPLRQSARNLSRKLNESRKAAFLRQSVGCQGWKQAGIVRRRRWCAVRAPAHELWKGMKYILCDSYPVNKESPKPKA
jgi:hypothetical protein